MNKGNFMEKSQINFFQNFFSVNVNLALLKLVYSKSYFNLAKIFVIRLFKMEASQIVLRIEQKSVIKVLVT